MKFSFKSFAIGFGCAALSLGAVTYVNAAGDATLKACANKTTGIMRYISKGSCKKTETSLSWNQMGIQGAVGATGAAGARGETGAAGAKGDPGAKGETGTAGSSFAALSVCDGSDANSTADELCAIGMTGPGGGTVFFVDTEGRYSDFDYLEASPADAPSVVPWSTSTPNCGLLANTSCTEAHLTTSGEAINYLAIGTGRAATAAIVARHDAGTVAKSAYAAGVADAYTTAKASDWWLPSKGEINELCKYARNSGQASGAGTVCSGGSLRSGFAYNGYWTSSDFSENYAVLGYFEQGSQPYFGKNNLLSVRPVRSF